jgi:hypothetical protein
MGHFSDLQDDDPRRFEVRRPAKKASSTSWLLRVTTISLIIAGGLALVHFVLNWTRDLGGLDGRTADPSPIVTFIGEQRLRIPANMFRFEDQRNVGPHEHVELAVHWPSLTGYTAENRAAFLDSSANAPLVFLTIRRRETATDSAGRLANIYQHFFEGDPLPAPEGLIGHRLSADSGLGGEEVYFEAGSTAPFTTHCLPDDGSGFPAPCLTEIHAGQSLSVQIRFRKGLLGNWAGIKSATRALLLSFGVTSS